MLYPIELQAHSNPLDQFWIGRGRGIRTPDPLLPKQVRYQTALCPVPNCLIADSAKGQASYAALEIRSIISEFAERLARV